MKNDVFRFKEFIVRHGQSSMKVGVDSVLLGAWAGEYATSILDVGTGCGVISLLLAQRFSAAKIKAIDIDPSSVEEASYNFANSPWYKNVKAFNLYFPLETIEDKSKYDLIVSNPPYFRSGVNHPTTSRERARHQDSLSVFTLLENCSSLLKPEGRLSMIFPAEFYEEVEKKANESEFRIVRECWIRNNVETPEKRVMVEFDKSGNRLSPKISQHLILFESGIPSLEYKEMCAPFYLKF